MLDLEKKLTRRLEESVQTRNAQQAEIKHLQAELQKLLSKIPRRPRESIPQLDQQIVDLERKRTTTSISLAEEKQILKQINGIKKSRTQIEVYQSMEGQIQKVKIKLDELKSGQKLQHESIQEIEAGLSKVKLATLLGCDTHDLTKLTMVCPREKLGMIIGKQGSRIQQVMATHKVKIDVNTDTCVATLMGVATAVESAKLEIELIARSVEIEISLPPELLTYLTGSHTEALTTLKSKYSDIFLDVGRGTGKAVFRGPPKRVEEAERELLTMDVISETRTLIGREISYLLGRKGSRIDHLVETHKVVIDVTPSKHDDTATAIIVGPPAQVAATKEAIQELFDSNREVVKSLKLDPVLKQILLAEAGKHIKALQSRVNEKLKEEDDNAMFHLSFPKDRPDPDLLVKAKHSVIESATVLTKEAMKELQELVLTFTVDTYIVPRIIGKGGETIKNLTHGKPMFLEVDRGSGKVVLGASSPEGREELLAEVQKIVAENSVLRIRCNPDLLRTQYRELGRSKTKSVLQELVWLDVDESNSVFILRGKQEKLEMAKSILEDFLASNSVDKIKLMDDDIDVLLSGGKGSILVKMSQEYGVNMSTDTTKGSITLRGHAENLKKAKGALNVFINGGEGQSVAKINATDQVVGTIIGKGGSTRKELESKYNVSIHISKASRVSIRGSEANVHQCRLEVLQMISAARVTHVMAISVDQQVKLQKNDGLKRIVQETHTQLLVSENKITCRGFFQDVRDAVSLINEKLTGDYSSSIELSPSQFSRVVATCRDPSHLERIALATETKVELLESTGEIQISGKRSGVRRGKVRIYDFLAFVCPGEIARLKITKPLYMTVGHPTSLAEIAAAVGGSSVYLDRDSGSIIVRDLDLDRVKAAVKVVQDRIKEADRLAYVLEIAPDEAWLIPYIIGKNGARIQSIQKGSDCHLDVSAESRTITVTGESEDKVTLGRQNLEYLVAEARQENIFVKIPEKAIPAFVGRGNKKLKDFCAEYGVEIQRVRKSSQFKIVGDEQKASKAKNVIDEWIENWHDLNAALDISVEKQFLSAILGPKGSTAQTIEKECECKVHVDRQALKVIIRGCDKEKRENALAKINVIISTEAAAQAERTAKKKEMTRGEGCSGQSDEFSKLLSIVKPSPKEPNGTTESKEVRSDKKVVRNSFPSHPVGLEASRGMEGKLSLKNVSQTTPVATEQGRNLFNLLVEG